jgi:hypothetical protein
MTDYDRRQFQEMVKRIDGYRQGSLPFNKLITDLEALLCALESTDDAWKRAFQKEWSKLELLYADALDRGQISLSTEATNMAAEAVENLWKLASDCLVPSR